MNNLPFQLDLRPEIPNIFGCADYMEFRSTLIKIDEILSVGGLEKQLVDQALSQWIVKKIKAKQRPSYKEQLAHQKELHYALRCNIARYLTGEAFRPFSVRLVDSSLLQWFVGIHDFTSRKAASKSTLARYSKYFDNSIIESVLRKWQAGFVTKAECATSIGLKEAIKFDELFMDSTCVKANIHFPTDWVLLCDAVKSLLLAITTIRAQGLKNRMPEPAQLLRPINKLAIEMTHTRRRKNGKKHRKTIVRKMKAFTQIVKKHGMRYRKLLLENWQKTDWSEKQMQQVIARIDNILEQIPQAIKQAHDRIIGERQTPTKEKILSLYDQDVHVIVRGKASNEVEFGNGLILTEQKNGLIVDWELFKNQPKADSSLLEKVITRIGKYYETTNSTTGDRGFFSKANQKFLAEKKIYDAICPKNPKQLKERLQEPRFVSLQSRRSQTEGRIGIFKNVFLGRPLRSKKFLNKQLSVSWCVLTHNLWVLARMALTDEQSQLAKAA